MAYIPVLGQKGEWPIGEFYFLKTNDAGMWREVRAKAGKTGGSPAMQCLQGHVQVHGLYLSTIKGMGNHWKEFSKEEGQALVFQNECPAALWRMTWKKVVMSTCKPFKRLWLFVVRDDGGWNPWVAGGRWRERSGSRPIGFWGGASGRMRH